jgi:tetratricopeptide (TPR) repeat protein
MAVLLLLLLTAAGQAQYAGSRACRACHQAKFDLQAKTGHARALAVAPPGSPGHWAFGAGEKAITYVSQSDADWYVEHGLSYYPSTKSMAPTPGHANGADLRFRTFDQAATTLRCFRCHSTGPLRLAAGNSIEPFETGVRCESCHGPGAAHIKASGARGTIRNPKELKAVDLNHFCGSCHRKPPEAGEEDDWSNTWNVRHQPSYLSRAACFRNSGGALSCLTCHDPHAPLSRAGAEYDKRCKGCHPTVRHRAPEAVVKRACVDCHMPQVPTSAELRFTNHWIGVYENGAAPIPSRRAVKALKPAPPAARLTGRLTPPGDPSSLRPLFERAAGPADLGQFLRSIGDLAAARVSLRKAGGSVEQLAAVEAASGKPAEAIDLFRQCAQGPDQAAAARCFSSLAILEPGQAVASYTKALAAEERASGKEHPRVALLLNDLALALRQSGDDRAAEPLLRRALAIDEKALGKERPATATIRSNLGNLLQGGGQLAEAESCQREAIRVFEMTLGPESRELSSACTNLADVLWSKGETAEAEQLYRRAVSIDESIYGPRHPQVAGNLTNLGALLKETGKGAEAEALLRRALAIFVAASGPDSPEAAYVREKMK